MMGTTHLLQTGQITSSVRRQSIAAHKEASSNLRLSSYCPRILRSEHKTNKMSTQLLTLSKDLQNSDCLKGSPTL